MPYSQSPCQVFRILIHPSCYEEAHCHTRRNPGVVASRVAVIDSIFGAELVFAPLELCLDR